MFEDSDDWDNAPVARGRSAYQPPNPFSSGSGDGNSVGFKKYGMRGRGFLDQRNNNKFAPNGFGQVSSAGRYGPSEGGFGGLHSKVCFKCGDSGHIARDCPSATSDAGRRLSNSRGSFEYGEDGHLARDSSIAKMGRGSDSIYSRGCFKCGEESHMARDCPSAAPGYGQDRPRNGCFRCGKDGHISRDCPIAPQPASGRTPGDPASLYIPPPPPEDEVRIFATMQTGINFNKYDSIPVEVSGVEPPGSIASFDEANLPETIRANVAKAKYDKPTPVQKYSIPIINADRDLMACAQTGSGKTAAFLLPVLAGIFRNGLNTNLFSEKQEPQAIVVGPTRELVYQIFLEARKFARSSMIKPVVAYGGTSVGHQLRELSRGCNILIATPGRLLDFINRGKVGVAALQYLILDEADRMLDMGFEPEIRRLAATPGMPDKYSRHTLLFSATFPDEIQRLAQEFLRDDFLFLTVGRVGSACSDVTQVILQVDGEDKRETLMQLIADVAETGARTLVFVDTKRNADFLASFLSQEGYPTTSIHGDRMQREREMALQDFKTGQCPIMIATSVAARGLDIPKVEHVINYDLPSEIDEYVHRIGRTGRCGNLGKASSFYCNNKDNMMARSLVKVLADAHQEVPDWLESCAEGAIGTSFGPRGGQFGARDARSKKAGMSEQSSRQTADCDYNDGAVTAGFAGSRNFGGGEPGFGGEDEDDWD